MHKSYRWFVSPLLFLMVSYSFQNLTVTRMHNQLTIILKESYILRGIQKRIFREARATVLPYSRTPFH